MVDASHRRTVPEGAVVRESADEGLSGAGGVRSEPQACPTIDARHEYRSGVSQTADDGNCLGTSEIPVWDRSRNQSQFRSSRGSQCEWSGSGVLLRRLIRPEISKTVFFTVLFPGGASDWMETALFAF